MSKRSAQTKRKMKLARREKKATTVFRPIHYGTPLDKSARKVVMSLAELELHEASKPQRI